jgi:hypothetical protein
MLAKLTSYLRSHHVALLALFLALGGTSYAAATLPADSVGTKQIKDGQVQKADLAKDAVGRSALTPLKRGETIHGVVAAQGLSPQPGGEFRTAVTFPIPAPTAMDGDHVDIDSLEESEDRCSGSAAKPTAPEGVVCIYLSSHSGVDEIQGVGAPDHSGSPYGFGLRWTADPAGDYSIAGTWAYTP